MAPENKSRIPENTNGAAPTENSPERAPAPHREGARREGARTFFAESGAPVPGTERPMVTTNQRRVLVFTWISMFFMLLYVVGMGLSFFQPGYSLADRIASIFLLLGIGYIILHSVGYANSMIKAAWGYNEVRRRAFSPQRVPKVACIVATFNEPPEVVEETVAALVNMDYPNKDITILDDSTKEEARQAIRDIGARFGATVRQRTNRKGYKAGAINEFLPTTDAPFVAVFDADSVPAHNFLRDLVPIIEENPKLAFVQTPQHYANVAVSDVALAAARQQNVFYEYVCEGKSYSRAAFCCGTNFVARRAALLDVGGFDPSTVTEDFATTVNLHVKGYDTMYYNQVYVYGMGPETLAAYFTQQQRWAFGTVKTGWKVVRALFTGTLRPGQLWEYGLSANYYWVGWVNFFFMLMPMLYIFLGVKPLRLDVFTYLMVFFPYLLFSMNMFYAGMEQRGYRLTDMLIGQQVNFLCFPVHMAGSLSGGLGLDRPFGVTPKGVGTRMSWLALWPQLVMLILSLVAFVIGIYRYAVGLDRNTAAIVINSTWALYHVFLLSGIFRFNRPVRQVDQERYFQPAGPARTAAAAAGSSGSDGAAPASGPLTPRDRIIPQRTIPPPPISVRPPPRTRRTGHWALALGILTLGLVIASGVTMVRWYTSPTYPVNVYILDRTTGRDYQEHRALMWTLNFLKVQKQEGFSPNEAGDKSRTYDFAGDFYGFVPGDPATAVEDPERQGDLLVMGNPEKRRLLPGKLQTPGLLYLADTYGEFVEYDYRKEKYIRYRSERRGIAPAEVDRIEDFSSRKGLLIGEWNTIGYPTLPGLTIDRSDLRTGLVNARKGLDFLRNQELKQRQKDLQRAQALGDMQWQATMKQQIEETEQAIDKVERDLKALRKQQEKQAGYDKQLAAQQRLEKLLHVDYLGWYGRFVDKFEEEEEFDFRLWKNLEHFVKEKFPNGKLSGPGFVFYRDGPSQILNPQPPHDLQPNPFSEPLVITHDELGGKTNQAAAIYRSSEMAQEPLLRGMAQQVSYHYWFDVVKAADDSRVLAWYKLQIKKSAADRLREARFPAHYLHKTTNPEYEEIVFPAAVMHRQDNKPDGQLRSFYFAGDVSDYSLVPRMSEMLPATGGFAYFLGNRLGPFPMQAYWTYYQPILGNIIRETEHIRYTG